VDVGTTGFVPLTVLPFTLEVDGAFVSDTVDAVGGDCTFTAGFSRVEDPVLLVEFGSADSADEVDDKHPAERWSFEQIMLCRLVLPLHYYSFSNLLVWRLVLEYDSWVVR